MSERKFTPRHKGTILIPDEMLREVLDNKNQLIVKVKHPDTGDMKFITILEKVY